jgi:hypothetical protein
MKEITFEERVALKIAANLEIVRTSPPKTTIKAIKDQSGTVILSSGIKVWLRVDEDGYTAILLENGVIIGRRLTNEISILVG